MSGPHEHYPAISAVPPEHTTGGPQRSEYSNMANTCASRFKDWALRMMNDNRTVDEISLLGVATSIGEKLGEKLGFSPLTVRGR